MNSKHTIIMMLLFFSYNCFAQDNEKHSELKVNVFNTIIFKSLDFSYEYLIDSESSVGASMLFNLKNKEDDETLEDEIHYREKFALTPFYRRYFSRKYAWGFFMEAFAMYNKQEDYDGYYDSNTDQQVYSDEESENFAIGMSVGGKFVSQKGFAFEFYGGIGRNLTTTNSDIASEFVPRVGASIGFRF